MIRLLFIFQLGGTYEGSPSLSELTPYKIQLELIHFGLKVSIYMNFDHI